jgi:hypothetical protein
MGRKMMRGSPADGGRPKSGVRKGPKLREYARVTVTGRNTFAVDYKNASPGLFLPFGYTRLDVAGRFAVDCSDITPIPNSISARPAMDRIFPWRRGSFVAQPCKRPQRPSFFAGRPFAVQCFGRSFAPCRLPCRPYRPHFERKLGSPARRGPGLLRGFSLFGPFRSLPCQSQSWVATNSKAIGANITNRWMVH